MRVIRTLLRKAGAGLANVTVESIHNVQGKSQTLHFTRAKAGGILRYLSDFFFLHGGFHLRVAPIGDNQTVRSEGKHYC